MNEHAAQVHNCNASFNRLAIAIQIFGCVLWVAALFLPAVQAPLFMGTADDTQFLHGVECFFATFHPLLWLASPLVVVPLSFINLWTPFAAIQFFGRARNGLSIRVVSASVGCIPLALFTATIASQFLVGFYVWLVSLILMAIAHSLLFFAHLKAKQHDAHESADGVRIEPTITPAAR